MISLKTKDSFRLLRIIRNTIFSILCSFLLFFNILKSEPIIPNNNSTLNYIHVLFEWTQIPDALSYNIQISSENSFSSMINVCIPFKSFADILLSGSSIIP